MQDILEFKLNNDPVISILLILMYSLAVLVICLSPIPNWSALLSFLVLAISLGFNMRRYGAKTSAKSVLGLRYNLHSGKLQCYVNHNWHEIVLQRKGSVVTSWVMCLDCINSNNKKRHKILIWSWQQAKQDYRSLAKQLRLYRENL